MTQEPTPTLRKDFTTSKGDVPWREDPVILDRLVDVEHYHLMGKSNRWIGRKLEVDESTIRRDLERLHELWMERAAKSIEEQKAKVLADLRKIEQLALKAAEFDQNTEQDIVYGDGEKGECVIRPEKGSVTFHGNKAAALATARQAAMDQAKVLGLLVDKVDQSDKVTMIVRNYDLADESEKQSVQE